MDFMDYYQFISSVIHVQILYVIVLAIRIDFICKPAKDRQGETTNEMNLGYIQMFTERKKMTVYIQFVWQIQYPEVDTCKFVTIVCFCGSKKKKCSPKKVVLIRTINQCLYVLLHSLLYIKTTLYKGNKLLGE